MGVNQLECIVCGKQLVNMRIDAIYCSNICGNRYRNKTYRGSNIETLRAKRLRQNADINRRILSRVKSRAKINDIAFDLELDDINVPTHCPVLGIELKPKFGSGYHHSSPSLDRIEPKLGYIKGNIRVISARANLLKNDATVEELEKVLEDLRKLRSG